MTMQFPFDQDNPDWIVLRHSPGIWQGLMATGWTFLALAGVLGVGELFADLRSDTPLAGMACSGTVQVLSGAWAKRHPFGVYDTATGDLYLFKSIVSSVKVHGSRSGEAIWLDGNTLKRSVHGGYERRIPLWGAGVDDRRRLREALRAAGRALPR